MSREEHEQLATDILDIGESMLLCGAEVSRVENSVTRLFCAYGAERVDVLTILSGVYVSVSFPGEAPISRQRRVQSPDYDTDMEQLEEWNALSRRLCAEPVESSALGKEIEAIRNKKAQDRFRNLKQAWGFILASGGFALFFGGNIAESLFAGIGGILIWLAGKGLDRIYIQKFVKTFLLSILDGTIGLAAGALGMDPGPVAVGCVMVLIPGMALTVSVRDTLIGDTISGTMKMVESLVSACFVAAGLLVAMLLSGNAYTGSAMTGIAERPLIQILGAGLGAMGFAVLFRNAKKRYVLCGVSGMLTWMGYLLCEGLGVSLFLSYLAAGAVGTLFAETAARVHKMPATITLLSAIIPLVPGRTLYLAMENIVRNNQPAAWDYIQTTVVIAGAVAAGLVLVSAAVNSYIKLKKH